MSGISNVLNNCFQIISDIILQKQLIHNVWITFFIQVSLNVAWPCFDSSIAHLIICATLFWFKYRSLRIVCTYFHSIIAQLENQVLPSLICCAARAIELNRVHTSSTYPHIQFLGNFWGKIPTRTVSRIRNLRLYYLWFYLKQWPFISQQWLCI